MWKKIDITLIEKPPARLELSDRCYYAREYAAGKGYAHSDTNSLISNFKKPVSERGKAAWKWKERAIDQFASELSQWLGGVEGEFYVAPIPSSKDRDHLEYDNRLEIVIDRLCRSCPKLIASCPVIRRTTLQAAHLSGGSRPTPRQVRDSLQWEGLPGGKPTHPLIFVDDVLTTGTTFKECQRLVQINAPAVDVYGVFWARTVWESACPDTDPPD
jgi:hypothetical protein